MMVQIKLKKCLTIFVRATKDHIWIERHTWGQIRSRGESLQGEIDEHENLRNDFDFKRSKYMDDSRGKGANVALWVQGIEQAQD